MFAKHFRDPSVQHSHFYPPIRMPQILVAILYLQCFLATIHTVFDQCRKKAKNSSNQIQVHVIPINLPKNPPPFNNNSFNADLATIREFIICIIFITIPGLIKSFSLHEIVVTELGYFDDYDQKNILSFFNFIQRFVFAIILLIPPLCYLSFNRKFRTFLYKVLKGEEI